MRRGFAEAEGLPSGARMGQNCAGTPKASKKEWNFCNSAIYYCVQLQPHKFRRGLWDSGDSLFSLISE